MRDTRIDFLRFTGLMMIILAHVYPPPWLFQLRNFDVPLMVFISGLSYRLSVKDEPYSSYVWARVQRLVFPVWIFLTAYFALLALTSYPIELPTLDKIWRSYLLVDGIGYVWVIRIFLLVALVGPWVYRYHQTQASHWRYGATLALVYLAYEAAVSWLNPLPAGVVGVLIQQVLFYVVPYGLVFAIGLRLPDLAKPVIVAGFALALLVYAGWLGYFYYSADLWLPTQKFKYPPTSYYLSFAMMMALLLYLASGRIMAWCQRLTLDGAVLFIGSNSIWIYLWHIAYLQIFKGLDDYRLWYLTVLVAATATTWLQVRWVGQWVARIDNKSHKKLVRTLLTG